MSVQPNFVILHELYEHKFANKFFPCEHYLLISIIIIFTKVYSLTFNRYTVIIRAHTSCIHAYTRTCSRSSLDKSEREAGLRLKHATRDMCVSRTTRNCPKTPKAAAASRNSWSGRKRDEEHGGRRTSSCARRAASNMENALKRRTIAS